MKNLNVYKLNASSKKLVLNVDLPTRNFVKKRKDKCEDCYKKTEFWVIDDNCEDVLVLSDLSMSELDDNDCYVINE